MTMIAQAARTWSLPDEPVPVRLMNTLRADRAGVYDDLATRDDLGAWLTATGLSGAAPRVTSGDLARGTRLRDALRCLAVLVTQDPRPAAAGPLSAAGAVTVVNAIAAPPPSPPRLALVGGALQRAEDTEPMTAAASLAMVAAASMVLLTEPSVAELRPCPAPGCIAYFIRDHPRREWCSTACGNRARAARHYRRHRQDPSPATA